MLIAIIHHHDHHRLNYCFNHHQEVVEEKNSHEGNLEEIFK